MTSVPITEIDTQTIFRHRIMWIAFLTSLESSGHLCVHVQSVKEHLLAQTLRPSSKKKTALAPHAQSTCMELFHVKCRSSSGQEVEVVVVNEHPRL